MPATSGPSAAAAPVAAFLNPSPDVAGPGNIISQKGSFIEGSVQFYPVVIRAVAPDGKTIASITLQIARTPTSSFETVGTYNSIQANDHNSYRLGLSLSSLGPSTDFDDDPGVLRALVRDSVGEVTTIDQAVVFRLLTAETVVIEEASFSSQATLAVVGSVSAGTTSVALSYSTTPRTGAAPVFTACGTATVSQTSSRSSFSGSCNHPGVDGASITAVGARSFVGAAPQSGDVRVSIVTSTTTTTTPTTTPSTTGATGTQPAGEHGYALVAADGGIFTFGTSKFFGSTGALRLNQPIVAMDHTPTTTGYWLTAADGGIFAFGDAKFFGSTGAIKLAKPIVGMRGTPTGNGYWLAASDGGIFAFGDAKFFGSTGATKLNQPIVGMERTPSGNGYWLVAADGGIFAFGDAVFRGSTGATQLNKPIVGMARTNGGLGYYLVASDGGIFAFGDAVFRGSTGAITLNSPITAMAPTASGTGYWLCARDGGVFAFGNAQFRGSMGATRLNQPVVGCDAPLAQANVRT